MRQTPFKPEQSASPATPLPCVAVPQLSSYSSQIRLYTVKVGCDRLVIQTDQITDQHSGCLIPFADSEELLLTNFTSAQLANLMTEAANALIEERGISRVEHALPAWIEDLEPLGTQQLGILVVAPDVYGLEGQLLVRLDATAGPKELENALEQALRLSRPEPRDTRSHARTAMRDGIRWESAIPVTDGEGTRKQH